MVAVIQFPALAHRQRVDRIEFEHARASFGQLLEEGGWRAEAAHAVADQVDLHAMLLLGDERLHEALADLVVLENVGLQVDVVARGRDGGEHRLVGVGAVLQQPHLVAGGQRAADDGLLERQVALEDVRVLAAAVQAVEDRLALRGRQRAARAFDLHRRGGAPGQVGNDGRQAAAAGQAECTEDRPAAQAPWPWRHSRPSSSSTTTTSSTSPRPPIGA